MDLTGAWCICRDLHSQDKVMAPNKRRAILQGIVSGLGAMHAAGIAHLDIKPENVMVQHASSAFDTSLGDVPHVRIGDFGMSRSLGSHEQAPGK